MTDYTCDRCGSPIVPCDDCIAQRDVGHDHPECVRCGPCLDVREFIIRDPFMGEIVVEGSTIADAVADAYDDIQESERPAYVWWGADQIAVAGGTCRPVQ